MKTGLDCNWGHFDQSQGHIWPQCKNGFWMITSELGTKYQNKTWWVGRTCEDRGLNCNWGHSHEDQG